MTVRLPAAALAPFRRLSLFDSPYAAHRTGHAIDLYPGGRRAPSPVAGTVTCQRRVRAPTRSYAAPTDVLTVIDTGEHQARLLHVDPAVAPGDEVAVGDDLGRLIRSGYFGPWVDDHVHLELRPAGADPLRASGSLPIALDVPIARATWDGTGAVTELAPSYATLDAPTHPAPEDGGFAGIAAGGGGVLDGGLVHYDGGGLHDGEPGPVGLLGERVGTARAGPERSSPALVEWNEVAVTADDRPIRGLACQLWRPGAGGVTLVQPRASLALGDRVTVDVTPAAP